jgi:hypothetical protein
MILNALSKSLSFSPIACLYLKYKSRKVTDDLVRLLKIKSKLTLAPLFRNYLRNEEARTKYIRLSYPFGYFYFFGPPLTSATSKLSKSKIIQIFLIFFSLKN